MNTRSLRFRLVTWYASLLAIVFLLLGAVVFAALASYLQANLRENQARRAQQIADTLLRSPSGVHEPSLAAAVESLYAPEANDRFMRITRVMPRREGRSGSAANGEVTPGVPTSRNRAGGGAQAQILFRSAEPRDRDFDPSRVPPLRAIPERDSWREVHLSNGEALMIAAVNHRAPGGAHYVVEVGASEAPIEAAIARLLVVLGAGLPVAMVLAVMGGFFLVRRALEPVDQIAQKAEAITQHNLSERLPIADSCDEIERLSVSLNHMISRLEEAVQSSKRFVADASHELRTPLTVLRSELESLMADPRVSIQVREALGSLLEEVDRLAAVVEGLLALSRLDAGEARSEWLRFDLSELVNTTADQMSLLAEDKDITMVCDARRPAPVEGDRSRVKQVVVNLLDNAIKYTPAGGTVRLKVWREDGHTVFEVSDTGIGIPQEALPHVFERFFRVEGSRTRERGGAGLGLSIVKSICTAHGARLDVQSSPHQGSCFRIRLPLAIPEPERPVESQRVIAT